MPNHRRKYRRGEPVWASLEGYPWWPARIITADEADLEPGQSAPEPEENEYVVEFFNDNKRFTCIHYRALRPFQEPRYADVFLRLKERDKYYFDDLQAAVDEARQYCRDKRWRDPYDPAHAKERKRSKKRPRNTRDHVRPEDHSTAPPDPAPNNEDVHLRVKNDPGLDDDREKHPQPAPQRRASPSPPVIPENHPGPRTQDSPPDGPRSRACDPSVRGSDPVREGPGHDVHVDVNTNEEARKRIKAENVNYSRPGSADALEGSLERRNGETSSHAGGYIKEEAVEVEATAAAQGLVAKVEEELSSGYGKGAHGGSQEHPLVKVNSEGQQSDAPDQPQGARSGYNSLSKSDLVMVVSKRDREIRGYRTLLWRNHVEQLKAIPQGEIVETASTLRENCDEVVKDLFFDFVGQDGVEEYEPGNSAECKELDAIAERITLDLQRVNFDVALLQATRIRSKTPGVAKRARSHSVNLRRALKDLVAQWVDVMEDAERPDQEARAEGGGGER